VRSSRGFINFAEYIQRPRYNSKAFPLEKGIMMLKKCTEHIAKQTFLVVRFAAPTLLNNHYFYTVNTCNRNFQVTSGYNSCRNVCVGVLARVLVGQRVSGSCDHRNGHEGSVPCSQQLVPYL